MSTTLIRFGDGIGKAGKALPQAIRKALAVTGVQAEANAKRNLTRTLHPRTGRLRNSVRSLVDPREYLLRLQAGGDASGTGQIAYAGAHEHGAIIRPKRRKFLSIPLPIAKTAAGVGRYQTPRDVPGLHFIISNAGKAMLVDASGEPWFLLVRQVRIPKRPYLKPALDKAAEGLRRSLEVLLSRQLALEGGADGQS